MDWNRKGFWTLVLAVAILGLGITWSAPGWAQDPFAQPAATAQDPFAPQPAASAAPTGGAAVPASPAGGSPTIELPGIKCDHITSALCGKQNTTLFGLAAGYVVVCVLLVSLLRAWWNKRGKPGPAFACWFPMLLGGAAAGLLAGFDPIRGDDLKCCLASGVFRAEVFLQDSAIGRAFLLGVLPALVLYALVALVVGIVKR